MKITGKRLIFLLLPLSLLLPGTLLWFYATPLVHWATGQYLENFDLELQRFDELELRLDGFDLAGLTLANEGMSLGVDGVSADFTLPRMEKVDIAELRLDMPAQEASGGGAVPEAAAVLQTLHELPVDVLEVADLRLVVGETEFRGRLRATATPLRIELDIEFPWRISLQFASPDPDGIEGSLAGPEGLQAEFQGSVAGNVINGALQAVLAPGEIANLFGAGANLPAGTVAVSGPFAFTLADSDFTFTSANLDLSAPELLMEGLPAVRADLQLEQIVARYWRADTAEVGRWHALAHFNSRTLELPWLAQTSLEGSLQLSGGGLRGTAALTIGPEGDPDGTPDPPDPDGTPTSGSDGGSDGTPTSTARVSAELWHRFDDDTGFADLEAPEFRLSGENPLSSLLSLDLPQGDVVSGSIAGAGGIEWTGGSLGGGMLLRLRNLSGFVAETAFIDLDTDVEFELGSDLGLRNAGPLEASLARVDPGLPLEDMHWNYSFDSAGGVLEIRQLQAALLGGTVSLPFLRLDRNQLETGQPPPALNLVLSEVDLAQVTGLANYDDLAVTGRVSGYLPVRIEPDGIRIEDGLVGALRPGGTIRYTPRQPASDSRMQTVNKLLSDYRFETLNSYVRLDESGELHLQTEITGTNPTVNPDQPINLNVNIVDNIPELLRSLRAGREISRILEEQLNRR